MFDIGFTEIMVVMLVALLVIGPERLPGLARKAGLLMGKAKRFISSVKADIDRELAAEELKRIIKEHKDASGIHEIIEETKGTLNEAKQEYLVKSKEEIEKTSQEIRGDIKTLSESDEESKRN
jgi:sec-independent protein translocase protein TatB